MRFVLVIALLAAATAARAAPAAPVVTVGADIKQLQFDWEQVPTSNSYELWFKANAGAAWVKYSTIPAAQTARIRINVSAHLLDWRVAKYRVAACNPSGCTNSSEVGVDGLPLEVMGYFKPNGAGSNRRFGQFVALSADGTTFAVLTGEPIGSAVGSAVVHVYRKITATSGWRREARLVPSSVQSGTAGGPLALSGDGNLLVLGVRGEDAPGAGTPEDTGAVYLFRREGTAWHQEQKLVGHAYYNNSFGIAVDVDDAGSTLAVDQNYSNPPSGPPNTLIYRHSTSGWILDHPIPHSQPGEGNRTCYGMALSGDGRTLVQSCTGSESPRYRVQVTRTVDSAPNATIPLVYSDQGSIDVNGDGTRLAVREAAFQTTVYALGSAGWAMEATLQGSGSGNSQRQNVAISRDGKLVVMGSINDEYAGTGPQYPPFKFRDITYVGSVFVYERKTTGWSLRRMVKPGTENPDQLFGSSVALGDNGRILAVGAPSDSSAATGIDGNRSDTSAPGRGAAWLY